MEYCLGDPDGSATMWTVDADTDLDGDGGLDAVGLDVDGDGLIDDVMADLDGDGIADHAVLDLDGDGAPEAYFTDDGRVPGRSARTGVGDCAGSGSTASSTRAALRWRSTWTVTVPATERLADTDGDGLADRAFGPGRAWVDTDGDGSWDVRLGDGDGDGRRTAPQA